MSARERYFLKINDEPEREVSMVEFVFAERMAGFLPKPDCGPIATHGFSVSSANGEVTGRIESDSGGDDLTSNT